jgi:hypothetical protein
MLRFLNSEVYSFQAGSEKALAILFVSTLPVGYLAGYSSRVGARCHPMNSRQS